MPQRRCPSTDAPGHIPSLQEIAVNCGHPAFQIFAEFVSILPAPQPPLLLTPPPPPPRLSLGLRKRKLTFPKLFLMMIGMGKIQNLKNLRRVRKIRWKKNDVSSMVSSDYEMSKEMQLGLSQEAFSIPVVLHNNLNYTMEKMCGF